MAEKPKLSLLKRFDRWAILSCPVHQITSANSPLEPPSGFDVFGEFGWGPSVQHDGSQNAAQNPSAILSELQTPNF